MDFNFLKPRARKAAADALFDSVVGAARQESFYAAGTVADDLDGRLELVWLFAAIAATDLARRGAVAETHLQDFIDRLFTGVDQALRDVGVGDMQIAKKVRKRAEAFAGRLRTYRDALNAGDEAALTAALARNLLARSRDGAALAPHFARYAGLCLAALATTPDAEALAGRRLFPAFTMGHAEPI